MKLFTLSAVCVLIYGLMIALSGITNFSPINQEKEFLKRPAQVNTGEVYRDIDNPVSKPPAVQDWNHNKKENRSGDEGSLKERLFSGNKVVRIIGILFILGWIALSIKLLASE